MVNILLAVRLLVKDESVSQVDQQHCSPGADQCRTCDALLVACACNVWLKVTEFDTHLSYVHVLNKNNEVTDLLLRWVSSPLCWQKLLKHIPSPCWIHTHESILEIDNNIEVIDTMLCFRS